MAQLPTSAAPAPAPQSPARELTLRAVLATGARGTRSGFITGEALLLLVLAVVASFRS